MLKEISKDIYDVDAWLDEGLGKEGTPEREKNREKAWEEYNAQILLNARKKARLTQAELAKRSGVSLRSIQMYEQHNKDINKASAETVLSLAKVLGCTMEDLLEK